MAKSPLHALVDILAKAVDRIHDHYQAENVPFPTLDVPFDESIPGNGLISDERIIQQSKIIIGAAEQLCVMVRDPAALLIRDIALGAHRASALRTTIEGNIPEILREAGSNGLHVKDIAQKNGMDRNKLARIMRSLATYHIYKEISPDIFVNNRISMILDSKKPVSELSYPPKGDKYVGSNGVAAFVAHTSDEVMKASSFMADHLLDPKTAHLTGPNESPLSRVLTTDDYFTWLEKPENEDRRIRFQAGMLWVVSLGDGVTARGGFPWETLKPGTKIVDVGGGVGNVSMEIAKKFPKLKFVVQDFQTVADQAKGYWNEHLPGSIESGRVVLQGHDFFKPQPVKDADLFVLRAIVHDWPTAEATEILRRLREVAIPGKTRLLLVETVLNHVSGDFPAGVEEISGIEALAPPVPGDLLANLGRGGGWSTLLDMTMLSGYSGQERMIGEHMNLCKDAGWKITHLYTPVTSILFLQLLAEPI